jgi:hypothetical protein
LLPLFYPLRGRSSGRKNRANTAITIYPVNNLDLFLHGQWLITRRIDNQKSGEQGQFTGQGIFTRTNHSFKTSKTGKTGQTGQFSQPCNALIYHEQGTTSIGAYDNTAHQRYIYTFPDREQPYKSTVLFDGNRPFHDLDLSSGTHNTLFDCPPDLYTGHFQALTSSHWRTRWEIFGPRKNMTITTDFRRPN